MQHATSRRTLALSWMLSVAVAAACYAEPGPRHNDHLEPSSGGAPPDSTASSDDGGNGGSGGSMGGALGTGATDGASATGTEASSTSTGAGAPGTDSGGSDSGGAGGTGGVQVTCEDVRGEPLPARHRITSDDAPEVVPDRIITLTKEVLWKEFGTQTCANRACHGGNQNDPLNDEQFRMTIDSFDQRPTLGEESMARVTSSSPDEVMPPGSGDGSQRDMNDPAYRLAYYLQEWQKRGFPEAFELPLPSDQPNEDLPEHPYLISPELGKKLTNIGSCVPRAAFSMQSPLLKTDEMAAVDALFAAAEDSDDLPDTLVETDLVSLESSTLASHGVYSYAPTYTLFSDNAGKMRHVRVPLGQSIRYNAETKDFDIPDNTRFYKTFLKPVKDENGEIGYRKMETRLIVVRRDEALPNGRFRPRALRTSYAWDKDETMAHRVTDPLRSGEPFADRLCPYVVDESVERDPALNPVSEDASLFCNYMTGDEVADPTSGQIRHYGIPSTERCDQCHMGSHNHSYILGFNPWQVDRRPEGEGGIYENPTADELTQLARLIELGVITGIEPGQAKLEESQGDRVPRNEYELKAQAYMMGNCVFCHNPHGYPVVQNPILADFELYPNEENGGIFQFSLERYSPRAKWGSAQAVRFPYISPVFGDHDVDDFASVIPPGGVLPEGKTVNWGYEEPPVIDANSGDNPDFGQEGYLVEENGKVYERYRTVFEFLGPWRSLIWRNVYTPFTYNEDYTIFIHMPRNVPGYDCRAHQIMADWMLSIPNRKKTAPPESGPEKTWKHQPVEEMFPDDDGYANALRAAEKRVENYHASVTGQNCPTNDDIVDPKVVTSGLDEFGNKHRLTPMDDGAQSSPRVNPVAMETLQSSFKDKVPDHAHWVPTDTTDLLGKWTPRHVTWQDLLVTGDTVPESEQLRRVIDELQSFHLSEEQKQFSLEPVPLGAWAPACQTSADAADSPTVTELLEEPEEPMRRWLNGVLKGESPPLATDHVHFQSRGEAVFQAICQNCHGRNADSRSPLAATILEFTGGRTRVANFIDGLFGPTEAPGAFAREEFMLNQGASVEDWQVRYMLFMGLGGTEAYIPRAVLDLVAVSPFYGQTAVAPGGKDPNMLDSAVQLCHRVLASRRSVAALPQAFMVEGTAFTPGAAHYELWESLCKFNNDPIVSTFFLAGGELSASENSLYRATDDAGNWVYPEDALVGNQFGGVEVGISPSNQFPWCVNVPPESRQDTITALGEDLGLSEDQIPWCPGSLLAQGLEQPLHKIALTLEGIDDNTALGNQEFIRRWLLKGAMNVGTAAYYFLDGLTKHQLERVVPFDGCAP